MLVHLGQKQSVYPSLLYLNVQNYVISQAAKLLKELFKNYNLHDKAMVLSFYPNVIYQVNDSRTCNT